MKLKFSINYFLFFSTIAVLAPYLQVLLRNKGFSSPDIGLLLGVYEISGIAGPLLAGLAAEKMGKYRLPLLIFSFTAGGILFLLGISTGFISAGISLVIFGLFYRPIPSLQDALASRILHNPVKNYGGVRIWGSIGFITVSLSIQLFHLIDASSSFQIITIFGIFSTLLFISTAVLPEVETIRPNPGHVSGIPRLSGRLTLPFYLALLTAFFIKMGLSGYYSFFTLYLQDVYSLKGVSGIWALGAIAEIPMILWGSRLVTRFNPAAMLVLSVLGSAARLFIYAAGLPLPFVLAAQFLHAFSFGLIHITVISVINHTVKPHRRAFAMSLYGGIGFGLAGFIGSSISGYVLGGFGFNVLYIFCGAVTLIPLVPVLIFRKRAEEEYSGILVS